MPVRLSEADIVSEDDADVKDKMSRTSFSTLINAIFCGAMNVRVVNQVWGVSASDEEICNNNQAK